MPLSRNSLIFLNNLSVESKSSAAEDSSRINTFVFSRKNALPIVIHALIGNDRLNAISGRLSDLEEILDSIKEQVFKCSPNAIAITKRVLTVNEYIDPQKAANLFSDCVVSDEGQEGINSFFEKRKPFWIMEK